MSHNILKSFLFLFTILVAVSMARVMTGTLHYDDIKLLDIVLQVDYPGASVMCAKMAMDKNYPDVKTKNFIVIFEGQYWIKDASHMGILGGVIGAVGELSKMTSWSSDCILIKFENKMLECKTSAARHYINNVVNWSSSQVEDWFLNNIKSYDI